ncbi:Eisosome component PIL1-domain-containing protein [Circinella umbellata]|nr:Eisosome component PIL1-domain-containing protein [Circinella umbellata]
MCSSIMTEFSSNYEQYCETMESIAEKEATLRTGREKKIKLEETIERYEQEHPGGVEKYMQLKEQLAKVEEKLLPAEMDMSNYQRIAMRESMYILLNGINEMASKMDTIATFAKYVVDELDVTPIEPGETRPKYRGADRTATVVKDAKRAVDYWKPDGAKLRRTLTSQHGHNPLVKKLPPPPAFDEQNVQLKDGEDEIRVEEETEPTNNNDEEEKPEDDDNSSFYSIPITSPIEKKPAEEMNHKPDEPSPTSHHQHLRSTSNVSNSSFGVGGFYPPPSPNPALGPGGFSNIYLDQNLYQFYQHYPAPQPYDEMARQHYRPTPSHSPYLGPHQAPYPPVGPGGFVLPGSNPLYHAPTAQPQPKPTTSTSTVSSLPSAGAPEPIPSISSSMQLNEPPKSPQSDTSS